MTRFQKSSKEFYYLEMIDALGQPKVFTMDGTDKASVEIYYSLILLFEGTFMIILL